MIWLSISFPTLYSKLFFGKNPQHAYRKVEKKLAKQNFLANLPVWSVYAVSIKKIANIYEFCTLFLGLWKLPRPYRDSCQDTRDIAGFLKFSSFWSILVQYILWLICIKNHFYWYSGASYPQISELFYNFKGFFEEISCFFAYYF